MTQLSLLDREWVTRQSPTVLAQMTGKEFTTDDVHKVVSEQPDNRNLFGVLMATLRCQKKVTRVGYRQSERPEANKRVVAVWRVADPQLPVCQ